MIDSEVFLVVMKIFDLSLNTFHSFLVLLEELLHVHG